jgi:hypothetical protein
VAEALIPKRSAADDASATIVEKDLLEQVSQMVGVGSGRAAKTWAQC